MGKIRVEIGWKGHHEISEQNIKWALEREYQSRGDFTVCLLPEPIGKNKCKYCGWMGKVKTGETCRKKISLVGWVNKDFKKAIFFFPGRFDCEYLETTITKDKWDKDDVKVRITIEELPLGK